MHPIVDDRRNLVLKSQHIVRGDTRGGGDVVVQVAVAEVAEDNDPCPGQDLVNRLSGVAGKVWNERQGQRNVVLQISPFAGLAFGDPLADAPERLTVGQRLSDDRVLNMTALDRLQQERLEAFARMRLAFGVRRLE